MVHLHNKYIHIQKSASIGPVHGYFISNVEERLVLQLNILKYDSMIKSFTNTNSKMHQRYKLWQKILKMTLVICTLLWIHFIAKICKLYYWDGWIKIKNKIFNISFFPFCPLEEFDSIIECLFHLSSQVRFNLLTCKNKIKFSKSEKFY